MNLQSRCFEVKNGTIPFSFVFGILFFINCTNPTAPLPSESPPDFHYFVSIPNFSRDSIEIAMEITENAFPCTLLLPPVYADNPLDSVSAPLFTDLRITDAESDAVPHRITSFPIGPIESPGVILSRPNAFPVRVNYRLQLSALRDTTRGRAKLTFMNQDEAYLQGNHLFAVPFEFTLPDLWRTRRHIRLSFSSLPPTDLYGIEQDGQSFKNVYELLFLQIILGGNVLYGNRVANQSFVFHAFDHSRPEQGTIPSRANAFGIILKDIMDTYGTLYQSTYAITMHNIQGGLEGTNSFVLTPFRAGRKAYHWDVMVLTHEALHDFIGIECGDRNDPWWKEGTTFYLGYQVPVRHRLIPVDTLYNQFVTDLSSDSAVNQYAPSSDALRNDLFHKWLIGVAYSKGGQIAMLLDDALHRATDNEVTLYRFTAELVAECSGGAFTRGELIAGFAAYDAMDAAVNILHQYADQPGAIPVDTLEAAFGRLLQAGAFGRSENSLTRAELPVVNLLGADGYAL